MAKGRKTCPACFRVVHSAVKECPACGHNFPSGTKRAPLSPTMTQAIYAALNRALTGPKTDDPRRHGTSQDRLEYMTDAVVTALVPFVIQGELSEAPTEPPIIVRQDARKKIPGFVVAEVLRQKIVLGKSVLLDTYGPWKDDPMTITSVVEMQGCWFYKVERTDPRVSRAIVDFRMMFAPLHNGGPTKLTYRIRP